MPVPRTARAVSVLGTASNVGKSLIATALCRLYADAGIDVAPYKAQNMALQAGVGVGGELGRAQILQARAARKAPHVDMNPVLLKPRSQTGAEVIVLGQPAGTRTAAQYFGGPNPLAEVAMAALDRLAAAHELIVMEGAGSPVELNLMARDFVNLRPARRLSAGLVLVADIDKGGVYAQVKGTVDLLPEEDRARLLGVVVNRFRGDISLFENGIERMEQLAGCPVLGVIPWVRHDLDEEDRPFSLPIDAPPVPGKLNVGVLMHPRVSNTEDLAPLLAEPDVHATWVSRPGAFEGRHLLILPGTKATVADLQHHTAAGLTEALREAHGRGAWVLGLCGGYQMLGVELLDPEHTDGEVDAWPGLGLLPSRTVFRAGKVLNNTAVESLWPRAGLPLRGYEIHHGHTEGEGLPLVMGAGAEVGQRGERAVGCYLHGLLAEDAWRCTFLNEVRREAGLPEQPVMTSEPGEVALTRWARHVHDHLRPGAWERLMQAARGADQRAG